MPTTDLFLRQVLAGERNPGAFPLTTQKLVSTREILGTFTNRRRRTDDGNRKRDISLETSLRIHNTLWSDVALKVRTWERGVSRRDENLSTSCFCFDPFSVLLCYFRVEKRLSLIMIAFTLKTMFWKYSWTHFFVTEKVFFPCQTTRKLAFSEVVSLIQRNAA